HAPFRRALVSTNRSFRVAGPESMPKMSGRPIFAASLLSLVASPLFAGAAVAQNAPPYPSNGGYDDGQYPQGGYDQPPQVYEDNGGYDDSAPPPQRSQGY